MVKRRISIRVLAPVCILSAVGALAFGGWSHGGRHAQHDPVGPWDTEDLANPYPDAPAGSRKVPDPPVIARAKDGTAILPDGTKVELVALTRTAFGDNANYNSVADRSWIPSGAPYLGDEIRTSSPFLRVSDLENKGARYLAFRISGIPANEAEIYGSVPDFARQNTPNSEFHGRDILNGMEFSPVFPTYYRPPIVVDDRSARRYLFALADGEWKPTASIASIPTTPAAIEVAKGPWGRVRMVPPPPERTDIGYSKHTMPVVTFVAEPLQEPWTLSYRLRAYNAKGAQIGSGGIDGRSNQLGISVRSIKDVAKITVEARPLQYVEFDNVHYNPEPKLWPQAYWGNQGMKAVRQAGSEATMEGILRPQIEKTFWTAYEFFAPDGKAWKEFPEPNVLRAKFSSYEWPEGELLVGVLKLPGIADRSAIITPYAADSDQPGQGLREKLTPVLPGKVERVEEQVPFVRPRSAKFVQFEIRFTSSEWTAVGDASVPQVPLLAYTVDQVDLIKKGVNVGVTPLTVLLRSTGSLDFFFTPKDGKAILQQGLVKWEPGEEKRLVAKLRNGSRAVLDQNGGSISNGVTSADYNFSLDHDGNAVLQSYRASIPLKDIVAFEVETRGYGKPIYVTATLPPSR